MENRGSDYKELCAMGYLSFLANAVASNASYFRVSVVSFQVPGHNLG